MLGRVANPDAGGPERLVIVVGRGHSGTRVLSHTLVGSGVFMGSALNDSGDLVPPSAMHEACRLPGAYVRRTGEHSWDFSQLLAADVPERFEALVRHYLRDVLGSGAPVVGWKLPETTLALPWIVRLFPDAYYLHIVRDPRDCILAGHPTDLLSRWGVPTPSVTDLRTARALSWKYHHDLAAALPQPRRWHAVRFEDLVHRQETTLAGMEAFLGLPLARVVMDQSAVGRWRDGHEATDVSFCYPAMRALGYLAEDPDPEPVDASPEPQPAPGHHRARRAANVERPIAAVIVGGPTPMAVAQIRRLASWCDVVVTESTLGFDAAPREVIRGQWHEITGIARPHLRVVTTDLPAGGRHGEYRARDSVMPLLFREAGDRVVLLLDDDEFLDEVRTLRVLEGLQDPGRLPLAAHYGAVDRLAPTLHCCIATSPDHLRDPALLPAEPPAVAGPLAMRIAGVEGISIGALRARAPIVGQATAPVGNHLTYCESAAALCRKLAGDQHGWQPRTWAPEHLETMLGAGVHHAGWWIARYSEPEPWLRALAGELDLRVAGPMAPEGHLRALRAWAEERLDPRIPDGVVAAIDAYAAERKQDADDFLNDIDQRLLSGPRTHSGYLIQGGDQADGNAP